MSQEAFYITTAIAYTNAPPHIGFALELCQADAIARYQRLLGKNVFFLTGTDEHGQKNAKSAAQAGLEPRVFVDEMAAKFRELTRALNISNDYFIRTSDQKTHWPGVQKIWGLLSENGKLYRKNYRGLYCEGCEAFKKSSDLVDGRCPNHGRSPEVIEEENWFFKLSEYQDELDRIINDGTLSIYPESRRNEVLSFIRSGLEDVSFSRPSRDLSWGIPVPGDPTQTQYVWADALSNYLTGIGYPDDRKLFEKFWPADLHIIGKDILRFHAVIWPAMLMAAGLALPKSLLVHGFITSGGQKMSKSLGNVVDPFSLLERYGVDAVRFYLLHEIPTTEDGDFTDAHFREVYAAELAHNLGNLVSRIARIAESFGEPIYPKKNGVQVSIDRAWEAYRAHLVDLQLRGALDAVFGLVKFANHYIDEKKPWEESVQQNEEELARILSGLVALLGHVGWMLMPLFPETAEKIFLQLGIDRKEQAGWAEKGLLPKKGEAIFPTLH